MLNTPLERRRSYVSSPISPEGKVGGNWGEQGRRCLVEGTYTVDVKKHLQNNSQYIISIILHQISKHELVTSVGGLHCFDVNFL